MVFALAQSALSTPDALAWRAVPLMQRLIFGRLLHLAHPPGTLILALYSFIICASVFVGSIMLMAMLCIYWERKVAGHIQSRLGPNRVGPVGLPQSLADGIKLITKEDLLPDSADKALFRLAPYLAFAPPFAAFVALPFGPEMTFEPRLSVGLFWVLAILSVEVMGVILAGWSSNNKWAVYGAMREACQMVSYEVPLGISILVGVMTAGTLNLVELGAAQSGGLHTWILCRNPFAFCAFFVYFIASLASNKRAPFDLPESESELVAGYHTEYSGLRFSFFFFGEYAAMFAVGAIQAALFLGSWNDPFGLIGFYHQKFLANGNDPGLLIVNLLGVGILAGKALTIIFVQMWIRWTLPRPRIDQVLYACVKVLLPAACLLLLGTALWQLFLPEQPGIPWTALPQSASRLFNPWDYRPWLDNGAIVALGVQLLLAMIALAGSSLVLAWIGYSFITGRGIVQRLTDPSTQTA